MVGPSAARLASDELDRFHASLDRCTSDQAFLDRFYELFLESSPLVREKFSHTDWMHQHRMMMASFHLMSLSEEHDTDGDEHLNRIATLHGRGQHDIPPELYDNWLECLMQTVRQTDPDFNDDLDRYWRHVLRHGIDFMISRRNVRTGQPEERLVD